jgi:N-acetylglucosaminyldiphosphoundecaprenol N-acetyl-beta-D-mannosaminyltransferase
MVTEFVIPVCGMNVIINQPDRASLLTEVQTRMQRSEGFAVATLNLDHLVKLRNGAAFRDAYCRHELVVADGNPIVWLSRLAGQPVSLVPGSDLVEPLCILAEQAAQPVALVGATSETLARAAAELSRRCPGLQIVARIAPSQNFEPLSEEADNIMQSLEQSGARLVFLALGAPRQEIFAARIRAALPQLGLVSVGAGLDFLALTQKRAPLWMRRLALEWLWRMLTSPRRLAGRYASCAVSLPSLMLSVLTSRQTSGT